LSLREISFVQFDLFVFSLCVLVFWEA